MREESLSLRSLQTGAFVVLLLAASSGTARAEGTDETGLFQGLDASTRLYVDIANPSTEIFVWTGQGTVEVFSPGAHGVLGTFNPGDTIVPSFEGAHRVDLERNQYDVVDFVPTTFYEWDVTVYEGATPRAGRVWSYAWQFNAGDFSEDRATDGSFYARVPGGDDDLWAVVEMNLAGLAGYVYTVFGNRVGPMLLDGTLPGQSVPLEYNPDTDSYEYRYDPEYRMYLNPPHDADYSHLSPTVSDFAWSGGPAGCDAVAPGETGTFSFTTDVTGTYHVLCDLDQDGDFDMVDNSDLHLIGNAEPDGDPVPWDGTDNLGNAVPPDTYQCQVMVTVGEYHYVGIDMETSYPGLRMYEVTGTLERHPLSMYWNDAQVQAGAVPMPNLDVGAESSPASGLPSGLYAALPAPHGETTSGSARAWGSFGSGGMGALGKGDSAQLDTYTWVDEAVSGVISVEVLDPTADSDGEGLTDYTERCVVGTSPTNPDSDGDGLTDAQETAGGNPGIDTDHDGLVNALDADDDNDGVPTADEDVDDDGSWDDDDADSDGRPNYLDPDDDGDGLPSFDEDVDDDESRDDDDTDSDGTPNYLDPDDDGDGLATDEEDADGDGDLADDDTDSDGTPNYLDPDDDGDGVATSDEDANDDGDVTNDDTDGDDIPNYLDADDNDGPLGDRDGDGVINSADNCVDDSNTEQEDRDDDGVGDACDDDLDGDDVPNETDNCEAVSNPGQENTDDDELGDACDDDMDNDDVLNGDDNCPLVANPDQEDADDNGTGDACESDRDGDGIVNEDDNCPSTPNAGQEDLDGDGIGDVCDDDRDGDDVDNEDDNCPDDDNPGQEDLDGDGRGDVCDDDADADGAIGVDDCDDLDPDVSEGETFYGDADGDGYGDPEDSIDACGDDVPEGHVDNGDDNCPGVTNPGQDDGDGDGEGDACDDCPNLEGTAESFGCPEGYVRPSSGASGCSCRAAANPKAEISFVALLALLLAPLWRRSRRSSRTGGWRQ